MKLQFFRKYCPIFISISMLCGCENSSDIDEYFVEDICATQDYDPNGCSVCSMVRRHNNIFAFQLDIETHIASMRAEIRTDPRDPRSTRTIMSDAIAQVAAKYQNEWNNNLTQAYHEQNQRDLDLICWSQLNHQFSPKEEVAVSVAQHNVFSRSKDISLPLVEKASEEALEIMGRWR
ncbi:hypothetical protein [Alteraurantiacibacter aquimixticola]|uniref:Uncharacterized protein n=1 Tax=Alteraurantiacibacter aquimixticola TaxID=2489173 RepID=A0A4T3F454_9SPHN|nr:hypothetical protein [Alteraurantiacibacter aquimixticola]TIX52053.1 hypothetical protein E5222_06410 [Alteraurantiacibacter aquimixticola]